MPYPVPATAQLAGPCSQPHRRTTMRWGSGKSLSVSGAAPDTHNFRQRTV